MTSNLDVRKELDFMKLKRSSLSEHVIDEKRFPPADIKFGNAKTSNRIPDSNKLDWNVRDPLIFCRQHFNGFRIESIVYIAFVNFPKPFNAGFAQETELANEAGDGAGGVGPSRKPEEIDFIAGAPVMAKVYIRASLHQLLNLIANTMLSFIPYN